jgi:peptidoglycan/xylan/chitin deacetylase (PgdA/CDA1 family)
VHVKHRSLARGVRKAARRLQRGVVRRVRPHGVVLLYHRVGRARFDPWNLCVSADNFAEHLAVLRRRTDIVPLHELPAEVRSGRRRPAVAITFDDGYVDNLELAAPCLAAHDAPATVFIATGAVGRQAPFWWDRLTWTILSPDRLPDRLELQLPGSVLHWSGSGRRRAARLELHDRIWSRVRLLADGARDAALDQLAAWAGADASIADAGRPMDAGEVRRLADAGIAIGSHTVSHAVLPELPRAAKERELGDSIAECERLTGSRPATLSYPHGEYDDETLDAAAAAGVRFACAGGSDLVWSTSAPLALPRMSVHDWTGPQFERWLQWN